MKYNQHKRNKEVVEILCPAPELMLQIKVFFRIFFFIGCTRQL